MRFRAAFLWIVVTSIGIAFVTSNASAQGGMPLWTNRYDGPLGKADVPYAMAADANGSVFVAGTSVGNSGNYDLAAVKYGNAGAPMWTNLFNGIGNSFDYAFAAAVDPSGNLLVAGQTKGGGGDSDFVTIKYSSEGMGLWTNVYDGPGNDEDGVSAVAIGNGKVFVTGNSHVGGNTWRYVTIAYSFEGVPLWTNLGPSGYDSGVAASTVDGEGNVIVAGALFDSSRGKDCVTIKYSGWGVPLWTNRYNSFLNATASAIAVDSNENVFVSGSSQRLSSGMDYFTIKYSGEGAPLWTNFYTSPGYQSDGASALAVDGSGNVYVTGVSRLTNINQFISEDFITVKYSSGGMPLWTNRYDGPGHNLDIVRDIAVDSGGNVYVSGYSGGGVTGWDYATIAYSSGGVPLWTNRYAGSDGDDKANAIALDGMGNVLVTGQSLRGSNFDFVTIKYSTSQIAVHRLDLETANNRLVMSWNNAALNLQSAPTIAGPFTNLPGATSPYTNPISGAQQFFRLISN